MSALFLCASWLAAPDKTLRTHLRAGHDCSRCRYRRSVQQRGMRLAAGVQADPETARRFPLDFSGGALMVLAIGRYTLTETHGDRGINR